MIAPIRRYARAFALALQFTLRGQKPPLLQVRDQHPELAAWWDQTVALVSAVERAAAVSNLDRTALTVRVDKRDVSMATILATVKYHVEREYPYLTAQKDQFSPLTLQATNINDRYLVMQLAHHLEPPVKNAADALAEHLAHLPDFTK